MRRRAREDADERVGMGFEEDGAAVRRVVEARRVEGAATSVTVAAAADAATVRIAAADVAVEARAVPALVEFPKMAAGDQLSYEPVTGPGGARFTSCCRSIQVRSTFSAGGSGRSPRSDESGSSSSIALMSPRTSSRPRESRRDHALVSSPDGPGRRLLERHYQIRSAITFALIFENVFLNSRNLFKALRRH